MVQSTIKKRTLTSVPYTEDINQVKMIMFTNAHSYHTKITIQSNIINTLSITQKRMK